MKKRSKLTKEEAKQVKDTEIIKEIPVVTAAAGPGIIAAPFLSQILPRKRKYKKSK